MLHNGCGSPEQEAEKVLAVDTIARSTLSAESCLSVLYWAPREQARSMGFIV